MAGPPTQTARSEALYVMTLREVLLCYLATRRWQREHEAEQLELAMIAGNLALSGVEPDARQHYVAAISQRAQRLREPELEPDAAEVVAVPGDWTDAQRRFLLAGRGE